MQIVAISGDVVSGSGRLHVLIAVEVHSSVASNVPAYHHGCSDFAYGSPLYY